MSLSFFIVLPFFALVLTGYAAVRFNILERNVVSGLNKFVFFFALPALLFEKTATAPVERLLGDSVFMLAYLFASLSVFTVSWFGARALFNTNPARASVMALGSSYANTGYMGIPLLSAAIGEWSAVPVALILLLDITVVIPLATTIIDMTSPDAQRRNLKAALTKSILMNPLVVTIVAGLVFAFLGWGLPGPIAGFTGLLGTAAGPVAMFTLGAVLAGQPLSHGLSEAFYVTAFKLAAHPAAIWFAMTAWGVAEDWRLAATLAGALPVATTLFVIAEQYRTMPERASTAVLISTAISLMSLSAMIAWLG